MPIHVTTSTTQSLSNKTFVDRVSTTGVVYASSGNSNQWSSAYTTVSAITGNLILGQLGISIDGGGSVITTGVKQYLRVPYNCTITSYELVADRSGSLIIDVDKSTYDTFSLSASIAGSSLPTLSNQSKSRSTDLAGWSTTTLTAGEYLFFDVTSAVTIQKVTLTLATRR